MSLIETRDLWKTYVMGEEEIHALRGVSIALEAGEYRAVVDRTYPLEDVVEATRYVESWQKTGNVVLTVA